MGVVGGFFAEGGQEFESGGVVALVEGFVGLGEEGVLFLGLLLDGVGCAGGELGLDWDDQSCGKYYGRDGREGTTEIEDAGDLCVYFHCRRLDPLPALKCAKSSEEET